MADSKFNLDDYVDVAERLIELRDKHPEASLQPVNPREPYKFVNVNDGQERFIVYTAACYRTPDDRRPGIGVAWEPYPGKTPYTKNSELQNAETSAWGRAIVAALAADTKRGVASAEEVRNRQGENGGPAPAKPRAASKDSASGISDAQKRKIKAELGRLGGEMPVSAMEADFAGVDINTLTKATASQYIDLLVKEPTPEKAERRSTMRDEPDYIPPPDSEPF